MDVFEEIAEKTVHGTWVPACPICGVLPSVGSSGSPETAIAIGASHAQFSECAGECHTWT